MKHILLSIITCIFTVHMSQAIRSNTTKAYAVRPDAQYGFVVANLKKLSCTTKTSIVHTTRKKSYKTYFSETVIAERQK